MYRFLLSRRWVITTLLAILLIPVMIRLGLWQLHRHQSRVAQNTLIANSLAAKPVPMGALSAPGHHVRADLDWRPVTATGRYDRAHEFVVRQRTDAGGQKIGYYVVTPLVTTSGRAILVNRGWVDSGTDATVYPRVPPAPSGQVTLTGRLRPDETTADSGIRDHRGLPARQYMLINSEEQARRLAEPVLGGYLELTASRPAPAHHPERVPEPDHTSVGPHLAYAVQWWLFSAMVPVGWVVLVRRDLRERQAAEEGGTPEGERSGGTGPDGPDGGSGPGTPEPGEPARSGAPAAGARAAGSPAASDAPPAPG